MAQVTVPVHGVGSRCCCKNRAGLGWCVYQAPGPPAWWTCGAVAGQVPRVPFRPAPRQQPHLPRQRALWSLSRRKLVLSCVWVTDRLSAAGHPCWLESSGHWGRLPSACCPLVHKMAFMSPGFRRLLLTLPAPICREGRAHPALLVEISVDLCKPNVIICLSSDGIYGAKPFLDKGCLHYDRRCLLSLADEKNYRFLQSKS